MMLVRKLQRDDIFFRKSIICGIIYWNIQLTGGYIRCLKEAGIFVETNYWRSCKKLISCVLPTNILDTNKYSYHKYISFLQQLYKFLTLVIIVSYNSYCKKNN
ncbi:MAG: hypothetical protein EGQ20_17110 [Bacteroides oleiciplenus]|nr:hypothetical protein [Bacteroides oleiciplenus]